MKGVTVKEIRGRITETVGSILAGDSLRAKVFRGGVWLGGGSTVEQAARLGRNMILTRLLAPQAFGTMAIVLSAASVLQSFTDIGVKEALVQNPNGRHDHYLNAAWWLAVGRAVLLAAALFAVAPFVASFYGNLELTGLLRLSTMGIILSGASSPRAYVAIKDMNFGKWATVTNAGGICGVVLTVALGFGIRDVWALAIGSCAESAARCALSYILFPHIPPLAWNKEAARDLMRFSRGLLGISFLNLIFSRADIFVLAKLYSPAALGLYTMGILLVQTPTSFVMNMLGQTFLPALSQVQDDALRTNRILLRVARAIALLTLPALAFVFFCARPLLTLIYGPNYAIAAMPLILACCVAIFNVQNGQFTLVFYASGRPRLHRLCVIIMAVMVAGLMYPLSRWLGFAGSQLACLTAIAAGFLFQLVRAHHLTKLNVSEYASSYFLPALVSLSVVAICLVARPFEALVRPLPSVIVGIVGCVFAYSFSALAVLRNNHKLRVGS